jgi:hypothetical protein
MLIDALLIIPAAQQQGRKSTAEVSPPTITRRLTSAASRKVPPEFIMQMDERSTLLRMGITRNVGEASTHYTDVRWKLAGNLGIVYLSPIRLQPPWDMIDGEIIPTSQS